MNLFHEAKKVLDKDGKVNALGPYGKQKLTGREIQTYFRRNKVKDKTVRKAVEVALDLGGAMDIAIKAIKDYYGNKILKAKEVQYALKFANEENFKDSFELLDENYKDVIKMYPRDRDWKKLVSKYRRDIDKLRNNSKDLPKKVEDDLISWALDAGEINNEDEIEDFIDQVLNASYEPKGNSLSEGKNLMPDIQKIVDTKGAKKVGGVMVDMFTASMINQIYNKVNDKNKQRMEKSNISTLVDLAQRMMQKMGDNLEEARITISTPMYNELQKFGLPRLMKKHDAYLNKDETDKNHTTISTPSGRFHKEIQNLIKKNLDKLMKVLDEGKGTDIFKKYNKLIGRLSDNEQSEILDALYTMNTQSGRRYKEAFGKVKELLNMGDNLEEGGKSAAQQAAIAISKKEKAGKPGYDKEGKSLKKESVVDAYRKMWESENLEEKREFKQSDIDKVAKLTDRNEHTKSLIHIAKVMGDKRSFKKLELIDKLHNEYGHLHSGLKSMRDEVYQDLKDGMKKYSNGQDMYGAT